MNNQSNERREKLIAELERTGQSHLADQIDDEDLMNHLNKMGHADLADRIREANDLFDKAIGRKK